MTDVKPDDRSDDQLRQVVEECIKVIESTNLGDTARTSYDTSLVEYTRQRFIRDIRKRFNLTNSNY
jgi:hypothetical protein